MSVLTVILLTLAAAIVTLASYISRVYAEFGKILSREVQDNIDEWQEKVEPHLGLSRDHAALSAAVLQQLALGAIALDFGAILFDRAPHMGRPSYAEIAQAVLGVVLVVVFCNQLLPTLLFDTHPRPMGSEASVAHSIAVLDRHAGHGFHSFLLFGRVSCRNAAEPRRRDCGGCRGPARGRRGRRHPRREPIATWCVPRWSLATNWCARS